jgi:hypothetical protein
VGHPGGGWQRPRRRSALTCHRGLEAKARATPPRNRRRSARPADPTRTARQRRCCCRRGGACVQRYRRRGGALSQLGVGMAFGVTLAATTRRTLRWSNGAGPTATRGRACAGRSTTTGATIPRRSRPRSTGCWRSEAVTFGGPAGVAPRASSTRATGGPGITCTGFRRYRERSNSSATVCMCVSSASSSSRVPGASRAAGRVTIANVLKSAGVKDAVVSPAG